MSSPYEPKPFLNDEAVHTGPLLFLRSIARVLGRSPLWLLPTFLLALLALPVGQATHALLSDAIGNRYHAEGVGVVDEEVPTVTASDPAFPETMPESSFHWDDLVFSQTATFKHDNRSELRALDRQVAKMGAVLAFLSMLFGVFLAGGWLQVILERTHGRALRRFCMGGGRYFARFFRVLLLTLVLLGAWDWLIYRGPLWEQYISQGVFGIAEGDSRLESLDSEFTARTHGWLRAAVHALGFVLVLAWATYTRTRLAMQDGRSVLKHGALSALALMRHPLRTLTPLLMLSLTQFLIVSLALGGFVQWLEGGLVERPSMGLVGAMGLVSSILALAIREVIRGAKYHSAVKVSQTILKSQVQESDPWESIGGPGGPQYPVQDDGSSYAPM